MSIFDELQEFRTVTIINYKRECAETGIKPDEDIFTLSSAVC